MDEKTKDKDLDDRLNILRAGVLGANDGIVSVAGVVIGVAASGGSPNSIFVAGLAAIMAGAFSMAGGEYVSVSTQADTEKAAIKVQEQVLKSHFDEEVEGVAKFYREQGIDPTIAQEIADDVMSKNPLEVTIRQKYGLEIGEYTNPWKAAISSFLSFSVGSILPMIAIMLFPGNTKIIGTVIAVAVALFFTGFISARLGDAPEAPAVRQNLIVGLITMAVTYGIGLLLNTGGL